jgi:uroporphyrinogen-III synthase
MNIEMEKLLHNRKIVVTRSKAQAAGFIEKLKALGAHPILFSTIQIREAEDWQACDEAIEELSSYDWLIFSSLNGAHFFLSRLRQGKIDAIDANIAAVGKTTAKAVLSLGHKVDLMPEEFSARGVLRSLEKFNIQGKRFLLPTSNIGREELHNGLRQRGALVTKVEVYRTVANRALDEERMRLQIQSGDIDCITFFSPSAFNFFIDIMGRSVIDDIGANSIEIAAMGPVTAEAIHAAKLKVDIQPAKSQEEDLVMALVDHYS